eukprot:SAG31_NODE_2229_length_6145_cov_2.651009_1_plen_502_part_00
MDRRSQQRDPDREYHAAQRQRADLHVHVPVREHGMEQLSPTRLRLSTVASHISCSGAAPVQVAAQRTTGREHSAPVTQNPLLDAMPRPPHALTSDPSALARATRPTFAEHRGSPVEWGAAEWADLVAAQRADELLDMAAVRSQLDRRQWELDGVLVLRGVMTADARKRWTTACQRLQDLNDRFLRKHAEWRAGIDWRALGSQPPRRPTLTPAQIDAALGQSQVLPDAWPRADPESEATGSRAMRQHSILPEFFPAGHDAYLMHVLCHPQMLALQRMLLDREEIYFCHNQLLNRRAGYPGGAWHSHPIGRDCGGRRRRPPAQSTQEYMDQPNCVVNLCYPEGCSADGAPLCVLRGGHLLRDFSIGDGDSRLGAQMGDANANLERGWMRDKMHPLLNTPLVIETLVLPPGSIVCGLSHAPHRVAPSATGAQTRWCCIFAYKGAERPSGLVWPPGALPPVWAMKARDREIPAHLRALFRNGYDRKLTGGRVWSSDPSEDHLERA